MRWCSFGRRLIAGEEVCSFILDHGHLGGRDIVVTVVVECVMNAVPDCRNKCRRRQPPDMPDQSKAKHGDDPGQYNACRCILWHVDRFEFGGWPMISGCLHVPPGINLMNTGREGEIVIRRWRRGRPFQGPAIPVIACGVAKRLAIPDSDEDLDQKRCYPRGDKQSTDKGDDKISAIDRGVELAEPTGDAHEAKRIKRHEGEVEADEPAPERHLAPERVELETKRLGEPKCYCREDAEDDAADDDVVEWATRNKLLWST